MMAASSPRMDRRRLLRVGGAALAATVAGSVAFPQLNEAHAETGPGERRTVTLPDGSRAQLNTRTAIEWRRWGRTRELWLNWGEVALQVVDGTQPFTLMAAKPVSLAAGEFNARRDMGGLSVIPLRGHASVAGRTVAVGNLVSIGEDASTIVPLDEGVRDALLSWRRGEIVFDGVSLADAVAEFNRYLERPLVLADPGLAPVRIGGRFATQDPASFLKALTYGFGIEAIDRGTGPVLLRRGQKNLPRR